MSVSTTTSRRSFLKGATAGVAASALGMASVALADEAAGDPNAAPETWDVETDVVVMGYGYAGQASAISAAVEGSKVQVFEKAPEEYAGGNSSVCCGYFNIVTGEGSVEYWKALADGGASDEECQAVAEATELLKSAGYEFDEDGTLSDATPLTINYMFNTGTGHQKVGEAFQQDMAALGIDVQLSSEEWNVFLDDRKAGNFDVAREGWLMDFDDPINMLEIFYSTSGNNDMQLGVKVDGAIPSYAPQNWDEYDAMIDAIKAETDLAKRADMMHQAEDMLMETGAVVPIYNYTDIYMQKSNVEGMYWNTFGYKYFMYCTKTAA